MKKTNIFTLIFFTFILGAFVSCKDGLTNNIDREKQLVSIQLLLEGQKLKQAGERTIGISSVDEALQGFEFTLNLVNTEDSTKNATINGDIRTISSYLSSLRLDRGSWKINVSGAKKDVDAAINGSTSFTVGGRDSFYVLNLVTSGNAPGSIEFEILGKPASKPVVRLYKMENYLTTSSGIAQNSLEPDEVFNINTSDDIYYPLDLENEIANSTRYRINGIPKGEYFLYAESGTIPTSDVVNVYPGLVSKGSNNLGKYKLVLDLQCGNQGDLTDIEVGIENGIFPLPGYGSSSDRPEPVRPGYLFTGWYDTPEAAALGFAPSVPLESKYISLEVPGKENTYLYANRTLYAGWKKADIPEELMNKNLFLRKDTGDGIFTIKGNFNNKFEYSGYSLTGVPQSYVVVGNLIYWLDNSEYIYFVDIEALEDNTETYYIQESHNHEILIPAIDGHAEDSNCAQALYYDGENTLYALCITNQFDEEGQIINDVPSIWSLVKVSLPEQEGENPEANIIAIENEADRNNSPLLNKYGENSVFCKTNNFVVNEEKMYVAYTNDNETGLASFDINVSSTSFNSDGGDKELSDIYQPTKYGVDDREEYYGEDLLSNVTIQDMYVDNTGIYLLIRDTSITGNGSGQQDTLVSTGAIVALDFDLNVIKTYGKAKPKKYYYSDTEFVSSFSVAHSYDTSCFAEPYKLLAVYDRKLIFQERGIYCYFKDESEKNYYIKKFLNRVTVFDLDKECIAYTQLTDADIGDTGSLINVSQYLGDHNFTLD